MENDKPKACEGGNTISSYLNCNPAQECQACGRKVIDEFVDHNFFGFESSCQYKNTDKE